MVAWELDRELPRRKRSKSDHAGRTEHGSAEEAEERGQIRPPRYLRCTVVSILEALYIATELRNNGASTIPPLPPSTAEQGARGGAAVKRPQDSSSSGGEANTRGEEKNFEDLENQ